MEHNHTITQNKKPLISKPAKYLLIVGSFCGVILAMIMAPCVLGSRKSANEGSAIASLRTWHSAQMNYLAEHKDCATLDELHKAGLIDEKLGNGEKTGYYFQMNKTEEICSIVALPISESTGTRSFYISIKGLLHYSNDKNKVADENSPNLGN